MTGHIHKELSSSISHRDAAILSLRLLKPEGRVDSQLALQIDSENQYWRHVLQRVVSVIKFLAERELAFRGKNKLLGSPQNGNFLGLIEVLGEYDAFIANH